MTATDYFAAFIIITAAINLALKNKYFSTCTYMSQLYLVVAIAAAAVSFNTIQAISWAALFVSSVSYLLYLRKLINYLIQLRTLPYGLRHVAKKP